MAEPLTALQIKRIGVKTWTIIENGIAATEKGENAYTGGAHENGTINIKTMNGATVRNQIPFQIISYTDTIDSSNNRASFTSAAQFLKFGNDVGFFVDGSSGSGGATSFIELEDTPDTYIGREGQALIVNQSATGVDTIPFNNVNVSTDLADFPAALVEGKYLKVVNGVWQLVDGIEGEQNNVGRKISLGYTLSTNPNISEVLTRINARTIVISETDTPVIVYISSFPNTEGVNITSKAYPYLFLPGKGTYGVGGTTVTASMLYSLAVLNTTPDDIESDPNNEINNLDPVIDGDFVTKANQGVWPFTDSTYPDPEKNYYFTYTDDGILYFALFVGEPGNYGVGGTQFTEGDFVTTTNSNVEPELPLIERTSQLTNDGEDGSSPYATQDYVEDAISEIQPASLYKESFVYSGSNTFNLSFNPTNVLGVYVNGQSLNGVNPVTVQYSVTGSQLTIIPTLETGDTIWINYSVGFTDSSAYSKAETDALISNIPINEASEIVFDLFNKDSIDGDFIPVYSDGVGPEGGNNYGMGFPIGVYNNLKKVRVRIYINIVQSPLATSILAKIKKLDKNGSVLGTSTVSLPSTPTTGSYPLDFEFPVIENSDNSRLYLELFSEGKFGSYRRFPNPSSIFTNANGYPPFALNTVNTAFSTGLLNNSTAYYDFYHEAVTVSSEISLTEKGKSLLSNGGENYTLPTNNRRYSFSGSSVTWGDGYLQSHYVGSLINKIQTKIATSVLPTNVSGTVGTTLTNRMYFGGSALKITGTGSEIEFDTTGDEVSIIQAIERSNTSASEIEVYIDDVLYDTFNNYNKESIGSETKNFTGDGTALQFDLGKAFTYNHTVTLNGVSQSVVMNLNQSTGFVIPVGTNCAIIRKLGLRSDGSTNVTHWLWFANAPANGASIAVTYNYGENLFYEKTTIGQDLSGVNESPYGDGNTEYDTQNPAATSSGLDFRQTDERVLKTYRFTENKTRNVRLRIKGNYNGSTGTPYFTFNFATNRFFHFQNAGIGGWDLWDFDEQIPTEPTRGWQKVVEFNPDYFLYETTPNDDVRVKGHRIYTPKNITLAELRSIRTFPLRQVDYQSVPNTYSYSRWNGIITAITPTTVTFSGTVDTPIVAGDIVMIGNYYANNNEFIQRFVSSVSGSTITFNKPISEEDNIFSSIQSFVGQEIRIRDYSIFVTKLETVLNKIKEVQPDMEIAILPNPLPNIQTRELWGYPMALQKMAKANNFKPVNCAYFQTWQDSQPKTSVTIAASSLVTDPYTGWKVAEFGSTGANTISPDVLVNGVSVYPNDAVVENGWSFGVSKTNTGAALNKLPTEFTSAKQERNQKPRLIFKQNAPTTGNIIVKYATNLWSPDSTHLTNAFGVELYSELLLNEFIINS